MVADTTLDEPAYVLVPVASLPVIDLSKSVRAELSTPSVDATIFYLLKRFHKPLLLGVLLSFWIDIAVMVVSASIGQYLSVASTVLGLPMIAASCSTLRYDIVKLVMQTFEFWSFFIISTSTCSMCIIFVGDLRGLRLLFDWLAWQNLILLDGQVRGLRHYAITATSSIIPLMILLVWSMLERIDNATNFSILHYKIRDNRFNLSGLDIMGNGLITLLLLTAKISYRKRKLLWKRAHGVQIDCAILRARLRLELMNMKDCGQNKSGLNENSTTTHTALLHHSDQPNSRNGRIVKHPVIEQLQCNNLDQTFPASNMLFQQKLTLNTQFPVCVVWFVHALGVCGLLLASLIPMWEWNPSTENPDSSWQVIACSWVSVFCTVAFIGPIVLFYHRKLLGMLVLSFDFSFYSFQMTSANVCVAILYRWEPSQVLIMIAWWMWVHWALTLDALTPIARTVLRLRVHYAAPVIMLFLLGHVAVVCSIFFIQNVNLPDVVIWEGLIWDHQVKFSVLPFYFSRVVTMVLWCSRLAWRYATTSDSGVNLIRGVISYKNCFSNAGRFRSRHLRTRRVSIGQLRSPRVFPLRKGPTLSAIPKL
ncbi:unnamed protein product [Phytophthora fragariaefolia]|uniref:Unnamed protein product n=1 Tax=Phytophthora fragariaefolia TaxID=1490495 RepID=A0A9W6X1E9_9STRA|nr:unnamed protein product [Phytophthora fragariaefolia]